VVPVPDHVIGIQRGDLFLGVAQKLAQDGELVAPDAPGLGLELDEAAVRRYQVVS